MNELQAAIEAIIYAAEEPATVTQIATILGLDKAQVTAAIDELQARYASDEYGVEVKFVAGGYRIGTKPQHHESVRKFIKNLKPPVRLSLAALETLAVVAYRQPITVPEIKEIRGVDPGGVINTLLEKKLITTAGRKEVVGKPILYKTTRDFLIRFGLSSLNDLPTLKEFEEMARAGLEGEELPVGDEESGPAEPNQEQPSLLPAATETQEPAPENGHDSGATSGSGEGEATEAEAEAEPAAGSDAPESADSGASSVSGQEETPETEMSPSSEEASVEADPPAGTNPAEPKPEPTEGDPGEAPEPEPPAEAATPAGNEEPEPEEKASGAAAGSTGD